MVDVVDRLLLKQHKVDGTNQHRKAETLSKAIARQRKLNEVHGINGAWHLSSQSILQSISHPVPARRALVVVSDRKSKRKKLID